MLDTLINTTEYIEYGILIAIVLSVAELVFIALTNGNKKLNPLAYVVAVALCALLSFQMSRLVGAFYVNSVMDDVQNVVGMFSPTAADVIDAVAQVSTKDIGWFIFRRCMWSVLFMAVAGVVMYVTMEKPVRKSRETPRAAQIGRRYTSSTNRRRR
jgi:Na+/melibiose symporter-like transporter